MRILLLGKNGQVGWELQRSLAPLGELIALDRTTQDGLCGDLADLASLEKTILAARPDVIVNAAAYTAVDKAESDAQSAEEINVNAPELLAKLSKQLNALFIHYSTDYVFDGTGSSPWKEGDVTGPLSVYGQTKLASELAIESTGCQYLIFRTSWVYASKGNNFANTMLRLASEREELNIISDQIGAPTSADLIADITAQVVKSALLDNKKSGIYHLAASGETSWYEYACYVIDQARFMGSSLKVLNIREIPSSEYQTTAMRPLNSRLDCTKICDSFDLYLPNWKVGVKRMLFETQGSENES
jgi:dTDP-4-dehydrorhamnose reductase